MFDIVLHNLKVANAYLEPQYVGADKGNIVCPGHRLCDCNTIWAETMTVNECYRDGCTGLTKCKYLKICKQMYNFASSTRAGAGCISVQSYYSLASEVWACTWGMVLPRTITDALQHDTKGEAMHTGACLLLFGCCRVLGWNFLKPLSLFLSFHTRVVAYRQLFLQFSAHNTSNNSTLEAFK